MSEANCSESELMRLLCDDGMQLSADGSMKARDAVKGVLDLHPGASKLALCTLANLLTKPAKGGIDQAKKALESKIENCCSAFGHHEPDTNAFVFDSTECESYVEGLSDALEILEQNLGT